MTLQRPVVAQLTLQAGLTYKVRLAPAFPLSALTTGLFAVSSVLRVGCGCPFVDRWVAPGDGRIASLSPLLWLGSTCGTGKALRCCPSLGRFDLRDGRDAALPPWFRLGSVPGTGELLRSRPGWGCSTWGTGKALRCCSVGLWVSLFPCFCWLGAPLAGAWGYCSREHVIMCLGNSPCRPCG